MDEKIMDNENGTEVQKYIDTIEEMKKNTVPRSDYDRVRDENTRLLQSLVDGKSFENSSTEEAETASAKELRDLLYGPGSDRLSDLQVAEDTLKLRDVIMKEGGIDPFLPVGKKISPEYQDYEAAERVAKGLQHCVDIAEGDNAVFIRELTRITNESVYDHMPERRR